MRIERIQREAGGSGNARRCPIVLRIAAWALMSGFVSQAFAGEVWVAVGYGGRRMVSTDGLHWEITAEWAQPGKDDGNNLMSVVVGADRFVAVGGGGGGDSAAGHILISDDGRQWREVFSGKQRVNPVLYGNGRFVAGVTGYPSGKLLWSDDATTWTPGASIQTTGLTHFRHGAYGNGRFVLVGNAGGQAGRSWAIVTQDGQSILGETDNLPGHGSVVFGAGKFLMLTSHTQADLISSDDGLVWTAVEMPGGAKPSWLVWTGEKFIVGDGKFACESLDGSRWISRPLSPKGRVVWSDGTRFIGTSWPGKMAFSPDGIEWYSSPPLTENGINHVVLRGTGEIPGKIP